MDFICYGTMGSKSDHVAGAILRSLYLWELVIFHNLQLLQNA